MARRKRNETTNQIPPRGEGNYISDEAWAAMNAGTYGRDIGSKRQVQYRTSQEQTQQSRQLPVLEGLTRSNDWESSFGRNKVDTIGARQRYAEKNNYKPIGKSLSNEDEELLYNTFDRNRLSSGGNAAIVHQLKNNIWHNTKDWEEKYGKTIEQIVEDYSKDYEKIAEKRNTEKGKNNKVLTTLTNTLRGGTVEPALDTMSTLAGKVAPNSPLTKAYRDAAEKYSKQKMQTVEGVTGNMSGVGKQAYELGTGLGERAIQYANPSALKYVLTAGKTAENTRQSLKERGIEGTNAEIQSGLAGLVDAGLDIVGLESVPALKGLVDSGNIGKEVLGRMAIGGGEQALTEFINRMIDRSNGEKSLHNVAVQNYMSQGMSAEDAEKQANIDDVLGVAQASVSGGLLNNIMGLGGRFLSKAVNKVPSLSSSKVVDEANQMTDNLSIAKNQGDAGRFGVKKMDELYKNDVRSILDKRGKVSEILANNPQIKRRYEGQAKSPELISEELSNLQSQISRYSHGDFKRNELFDLGETPGILKDSGVLGKRIMLKQSMFDKIAMPEGFIQNDPEYHYHGLGSEGVEKIFDGLNDPVATLKLKDEKGEDTVVAIINYTSKKGTPVLTAMTLGKDGTIQNISDIEGSARLKTGHIRGGLDNYLKNNESNIKYIIGEDKTLGVGLGTPEPELSSPIENNVNPIDQNVNRTINESAGQNPRLTQEVRGLAGDELKAAQDRVSSNKAQIKALENEIKVIESDPNNKYRGNLKKSAKADIESRKAQIVELKQDNKVTTRRIKGEPTPVIEQLDADSVTRINDFKKEVRKIGNMWGGEGGKQLAKDVNDALDRYIESGSQEDFNTFARDLWQLHSSANGEYTSKAGNVSRYSDYYGDIEDGIFGASIKDNGMLPQKAIRDFHNARTMNESVGGNPTLTSEVPPTNNRANDEVATLGNRRTSQYYTNTMRNTPTNAEMDDAEYGARFNRDEYGYITSSHKETDAKSNQFIQESGGEDGAIDRILSDDFTGDDSFDAVHIDAAEKLADKVERQAKELEAQGQDATEQWMLANRLHKKIRENGTIHAKGLEILKKWKQSTPQGQVDYIVTVVNKSVDSHKTKGYTNMVNNMADDVEDAILNSPDKNTLISNIKKIFANNRANSDYKTDKYEQLVLDLVGGEDFGKRSPASIAEEAGALIKSQMGVSSLTAKQERAMIDLFEQASRYEQNSRAYNECIGRAMDILDSTLPSSFGNKARSLAYDNMLASLKTMLTRNLGGNVLANAIETTSRPLQVLADVVASGVTKKRTRTLTGNSIVEGGRGFKKGVKDWYLDVKQGINTTRSGQGSLEDALNAAHKTFKTQSPNRVIKGVNTALGGYDRVVRKGMELGDRPIYEMRYSATKAELLDVVDKFGDEGLRKGLPEGKDVSTDELIELIAVNEGLEAVLQNNSTLKEGAKALKKAISKTSEDILGVDVATMSTTPFVEVPANMASRFFQYTPLGIVGNIVRSIGEKVKTGAVNQRRMTGEAGRNALGLLMQAGAMGLAANNFISDPYSEDPDEKKIQQNNDYIEYALQTPDGERQADLSDVPNLGPMLRYGKMQYNALQEGGIPGLIGNIPNAAGAATVDTLYQGLNKLTGATNKYSSGDSMLSNAKNAVVSSIGSMIIPAFIRQTAQFHDPYKRDLGDYGTSEYNKNLIINGLPILRETMLNPKIGTSGEPVKQTGGDASFSKFFNTYIAPWKVSTPKENMSEAQRYAEMLKEQTDGKVNPQPPVFNAKDLKGIKGYDKENYTHEDLYDIDNKLYNYNDDIATKLVRDEWYRSLSPEKQGRYLDMLYSSGKEVVKEDFARKGMTTDEIEKAGKDIYTVDSKLAKILKEDDNNLTGMKDYFHNLDGIENLEEKYGYKMDYDTYVKWNTDPDKKSLGGAEKYAEVHDAAKELDMKVEDYLKKEAEQPGGAQAFVENKQSAMDAGFVKKDGTANIEAYDKAVSIVGNDVPKLNAYNEIKDFKKNADLVPALMNSNAFSDDEKGQIVMAQHGYKYDDLGATAKGTYDREGAAGVYYFYLLKNLADTDGNGSVKKAEKEALLNSDNPYVTQLSDDMYYYLAGAEW